MFFITEQRIEMVSYHATVHQTSGKITRVKPVFEVDFCGSFSVDENSLVGPLFDGCFWLIQQFSRGKTYIYDRGCILRI